MTKPPTVVVSVRLPPDVLERWRASGPGYATRMAEVLTEWVGDDNVIAPAPRTDPRLWVTPTGPREAARRLSTSKPIGYDMDGKPIYARSAKP